MSDLPTCLRSLAPAPAAAVLAVILGLLPVVPAHAVGGLQPTESEWAGWPDFCRAVHVPQESALGFSEFSQRVPAGFVEAWRTRLGPKVWFSLHHYCWGLARYERARLAGDPAVRKFEVDQAISEYTYTINRMPREAPMYAEVANAMGQAHRLGGNVDKALSAFGVAIETHPDLPGGYQGKALVYRDAKRYAEARDVLLDADRVTGGESSEINYFLGLILCDMKDYAAARPYAAKAYALGYPLPGLRDRLARAGFPLE